MDNITYNSIKNELLDVINGRLNDFNIEISDKIESFKNEMTELFNNRIIDYATTSNHNFDEAKNKIDETLNIIKSDFDKSISKFDKASEILNFGNLNINSDSIISLFSAQTISDNAIKQLSGSVFTIKDNIKKIENKQDDFIFNLSGVSFNSGFTLDFSGSMMTTLQDELNKTFNSRFETLNKQISGFTGQITNFDNKLNGFDGKITEFNKTLGEVDGKITSFEGTLGGVDGKITNFEETLNGFDGQITEFNETLSGVNGKITNFESTLSEFDAIGDDIEQVKSSMNELNGKITNFESTLSGINTSIETVNNDISGLTRQINNFESDIENVKFGINTLSGRMDNFITSGYLEDKKFICKDNLNDFDIVTDESLTNTLSGYTTTEQVTGMIKFHIPDSLG